MEQLSNITYNAINRYYNALAKLGYINQDNVSDLIALSFIEDIFDLFSFYITEEDYNDITKAIECLAGASCLIDFPTYKTYNSLITKTKYKTFRGKLSEDGMIKTLENNAMKAQQ